MRSLISHSAYERRLDEEARQRIARAIETLIDLLDADDASDPAHECEGQELWHPKLGWIGVDPDLALNECAVEALTFGGK